MMRRIAIAIGVVGAACSSKPVPSADDHGAESTKPLEQAIVGTWLELCTSEREAATNCPGDDGGGRWKRFDADGRIETLGRMGTHRGTWTLHGSTLELHYELGGKPLVEGYRARMFDGRLVLWEASLHFNTIYERQGTITRRSPTTIATSTPVTASIGDVRYTATLPAGYRLAAEERWRHKWSPPDGEGLEVELTVQERVPAGQPCTTPPSGDGGEKDTIGGVERWTMLARTTCTDGFNLRCAVRHTRGYLNDDDMEPARALCKPIVVE